jgi:hypothetical protein
VTLPPSSREAKTARGRGCAVGGPQIDLEPDWIVDAVVDVAALEEVAGVARFAWRSRPEEPVADGKEYVDQVIRPIVEVLRNALIRRRDCDISNGVRNGRRKSWLYCIERLDRRLRSCGNIEIVSPDVSVRGHEIVQVAIGSDIDDMLILHVGLNRRVRCNGIKHRMPPVGAHTVSTNSRAPQATRRIEPA